MRPKNYGKIRYGLRNAQFWGLKTWGQGGPGLLYPLENVDDIA